MGATQYQGVDVPWGVTKDTHLMHIAIDQRNDVCIVVATPTLFDGIGQSLASLQHIVVLRLQSLKQIEKFLATQGACRGHHADSVRAADQARGFDGRLDTEDGPVGVFLAQQVNGMRGGCVASHHQGFDRVLFLQCTKNVFGSFQHESVVTVTIRCMGAVGHIHERFVGHGLLHGQQDAQATHTAVKHADGFLRFEWV